ncbi:MAG: Rieske 2Fe-2S domain-containing protein [Candidatus Eiseniibacteriota bacterium]
MLVTQQKVLRRFWYGLMPLGELEGGPKAFTLLGEKIVLFLDRDGKPAALQDRCCHRTAPLSRGRVEDGAVVCGYHGWTFDRDGKCIRIPQQTTVGPRIGVKAYRCEARYGYVWVCLDEPLYDIPELSEAADPSFRRIHEFHEIWDTAALRIIENAFDNAHFSYVHAASFGDEKRPEPAALKLTPTEWGFVMDTVVPVRNPDEIQKRNLHTDDDETLRTYKKVWWMPFSVKMTLSYPSGVVHIIVAMITPVDDRRTMFTQFVLRNDSEADAPAAGVIAWDRRVTAEDRAMLELTEPDVPLDLRSGEEFHMAADQPGLEVRRRLLQLLTEHGEREVRALRPADGTAVAAE